MTMIIEVSLPFILLSQVFNSKQFLTILACIYTLVTFLILSYSFGLTAIQTVILWVVVHYTAQTMVDDKKIKLIVLCVSALTLPFYPTTITTVLILIMMLKIVRKWIKIRKIYKALDIVIMCYLSLFHEARQLNSSDVHNSEYIYNTVLCLVAIVITFFMSALSLYIWKKYLVKEYDGVGVKIGKMGKKLDKEGKVTYIINDGIVNAMAEEFIFRGVIQFELMKYFDPYTAILIQALSFGFCHYNGGYPDGLVGSLLTFVFGYITGVLYYVNGGLILPVFVHAIADMVINYFTIIGL